MIKVVAKNIVKKDKIEEFIKVAKPLVEATNKLDEGCKSYDIYQDVNDPQVISMLEAWESKEALNKHLHAPHFKEIFPKLAALTEGPAEVTIYRPL